MKIIYHCFGGAHSSVTAANIHLKRLPADCRIDLIKSQHLFDSRENIDAGRIIYMGTDIYKNEVYIVGRHGRPHLLYSVLAAVMGLMPENCGPCLLVDTSVHVNLPMRIGGFLSRRLGMVTPGRHIAAGGVFLAYKSLLKTVCKAVSYGQGKKDPGIGPQFLFIQRGSGC